MRLRELRGWDAAVRRASELWPDIPAWAFELAAEQEAPIRTYEESEWFTVHPAVAADHAVRIAYTRGWIPGGRPP